MDILTRHGTTIQWSVLKQTLAGPVTITSMDEQALAALPRAYRVGLRLRALGADHALIADCLDIDVDAVGTLLDIAARKLEHVVQPNPAPATPPTP